MSDAEKHDEQCEGKPENEQPKSLFAKVKGTIQKFLESGQPPAGQAVTVNAATGQVAVGPIVLKPIGTVDATGKITFGPSPPGDVLWVPLGKRCFAPIAFGRCKCAACDATRRMAESN